MRLSPQTALALGAALFFWACSGSRYAAQGPMATDAGTVEVLINFADGTVSVSPDPLEVGRRLAPVVTWSAGTGMQGRDWIVGFGGPTPFKSHRSVFTSDEGRQRGPIDQNTGLGDYKYWVWVSGDDGEWIPLDPKIVIIDDPGPDTIPEARGRR